MNDVFDIEALPRNILQYMLQFLKVPEVRNLLLTTKVIYRKIPRSITREYLWCLKAWPCAKLKVENDHHICKKCGAYVKRTRDMQKHSTKCQGKRQCYICYRWLDAPYIPKSHTHSTVEEVLNGQHNHNFNHPHFNFVFTASEFIQHCLTPCAKWPTRYSYLIRRLVGYR